MDLNEWKARAVRGEVFGGHQVLKLIELLEAANERVAALMLVQSMHDSVKADIRKAQTQVVAPKPMPTGVPGPGVDRTAPTPPMPSRKKKAT